MCVHLHHIDKLSLLEFLQLLIRHSSQISNGNSLQHLLHRIHNLINLHTRRQQANVSNIQPTRLPLGTFLNTRGPPSPFLSTASQPADIALLNPTLALGEDFCPEITHVETVICWSTSCVCIWHTTMHHVAMKSLLQPGCKSNVYYCTTGTVFAPISHEALVSFRMSTQLSGILGSFSQSESFIRWGRPRAVLNLKIRKGRLVCHGATCPHHTTCVHKWRSPCGLCFVMACQASLLSGFTTQESFTICCYSSRRNWARLLVNYSRPMCTWVISACLSSQCDTICIRGRWVGSRQ